MISQKLWMLVLVLALLAAGCAPENLDITPTPAPTPVPIIKIYVTGAVKESGKTVELPLGSRIEDAINAAGGAAENADLQRINLVEILRDGQQVTVPTQGEALAVEPTVEPTAEVAAADDPKAFLEKLVEMTPENMRGGAIEWRRDPANPPVFATPRGGNTVRISYTDPGGSLLELTYGIWPDAEGAKTFFDVIVNSLQAQTRTSERSGYPTPNAFGEGGTYGAAGIFQLDTIIVRIAIPRYNTVTVSDPVGPLVNEILGYVEKAKAGQ